MPMLPTLCIVGKLNCHDGLIRNLCESSNGIVHRFKSDILLDIIAKYVFTMDFVFPCDVVLFVNRLE